MFFFVLFVLVAGAFGDDCSGIVCTPISACDILPFQLQTAMDPMFYEIVCRQAPCQSAPIVAVYDQQHKAITVTSQTTKGEFIHQRDGRGGADTSAASTVWFYTDRGCWVWSGVTQHAVWNHVLY